MLFSHTNATWCLQEQMPLIPEDAEMQDGFHLSREGEACNCCGLGRKPFKTRGCYFHLFLPEKSSLLFIPFPFVIPPRASSYVLRRKFLPWQMPAANTPEPSVVSALDGVLQHHGLFWNMISKWVLQSSAVTSGSLWLVRKCALGTKDVLAEFWKY